MGVIPHTVAAGYRDMGKFIDELIIDSCNDTTHLGLYKKIKCALTFVNYEQFGCVCENLDDEVSEKFNIKNVVDEKTQNNFCLSYIAYAMLTGASITEELTMPLSTDRCLDIHRIFTNGISDSDYPPDNAKFKKYSKKCIHYLGSVLIFDTMRTAAEYILEKASHKKVGVDLQISAVYNLGAYKSIEEAKKEYNKEYGNYEIGVDTVVDRENLVSSEHEFVERIIDEYMTRTEIESEWDESSDEVDVDQEFEDNIKLGIFKAIFYGDEEMYEKILELNNYKVIKNDNGGRIVCHPLT